MTLKTQYRLSLEEWKGAALNIPDGQGRRRHYFRSRRKGIEKTADTLPCGQQGFGICTYRL
jgi:hypothetical protein